jgi:hypothetical protein
MRKGAAWLKTTLVQYAIAAVKKKNTYFQAQFHRLRSRRGAKEVICGVAASMLTAIYHMVKDGTRYKTPVTTIRSPRQIPSNEASRHQARKSRICRLNRACHAMTFYFRFLLAELVRYKAVQHSIAPPGVDGRRDAEINKTNC